MNWESVTVAHVYESSHVHPKHNLILIGNKGPLGAIFSLLKVKFSYLSLTWMK